MHQLASYHLRRRRQSSAFCCECQPLSYAGDDQYRLPYTLDETFRSSEAGLEKIQFRISKDSPEV